MTAEGGAKLGELLAPVRRNLGRALVALDFDGTLSAIVPRPEDAALWPGALEVLTALTQRGVSLAVVTGRPALTVVELGTFDQVPGLIVLGHYGLQRWEAGSLATPPPNPAVRRVRTELPPLPAGAMVEDKLHSIVVHTRGCADPEAALEALREPIATLAAAHGLEVVAGRYVWEVRPPGVDKGTAFAALIAEREPTAVLVAGDDLGDLPLFAAALASGVPAVRIAVVSEGAAPEVALAADIAVAGPEALVAVLRSLL